ncbi:hypothetical protein HCEG_01043 [Histoplasma capsulatum var. duboisii H88]|uniref:Uncharacterized protein n=1 Tax=Ajellomyces capsulatus (strain H88) TaxID=544711 RepID=F0U868_AJEC8|nr:hypothetical protein HCEG_01043 [Histoplasma capsulatum var. duboisii H88]
MWMANQRMAVRTAPLLLVRDPTLCIAMHTGYTKQRRCPSSAAATARVGLSCQGVSATSASHLGASSAGPKSSHDAILSSCLARGQHARKLGAWVQRWIVAGKHRFRSMLIDNLGLRQVDIIQQTWEQWQQWQDAN